MADCLCVVYASKMREEETMHLEHCAAHFHKQRERKKLGMEKNRKKLAYCIEKWYTTISNKQKRQTKEWVKAHSLLLHEERMNL